ncbi:hypothetical protein M3223_07335 [Paenibacillus pasadenensis]|nr:hypothetical protein [Paenibacillus pasadenensis]
MAGSAVLGIGNKQQLRPSPLASGISTFHQASPRKTKPAPIIYQQTPVRKTTSPTGPVV